MHGPVGSQAMLSKRQYPEQHPSENSKPVHLKDRRLLARAMPTPSPHAAPRAAIWPAAATSIQNDSGMPQGLAHRSAAG